MGRQHALLAPRFRNGQSHIVPDRLPWLEPPSIVEGTAEAVDTSDGPEKHINNVDHSAETMPHQDKNKAAYANCEISLGDGHHHGVRMSA